MYVDLFGPLPPPHGGVSVHVERLAQRLREAGVGVAVFDPQRPGEGLFESHLRYMRAARGDLRHFHLTGALDRALLPLHAAGGARVVLTVHGQSVESQDGRLRGPARALYRGALRSLAGIIAVNDHIRDYCVGAVGVRPERVRVIPAFLPPDRAALQAEDAGDDVMEFARAHRPLLSLAAYSMDPVSGGPLYGLDLAIEALPGLRARWPDLGLLVYVAVLRGEGRARLRAHLERAQGLGVADALHVVTGSRPFGPALVRSHVFVRPTRSDGDAVSVREARWLGIPVVASDVVARPEGCLLFATGDARALGDAVSAALSAPPPPSGGGADPFRDVLAFYEDLLHHRASPPTR